GFMGGLSGTTGFSSYTLWVANWGVSCPNVPSPWTGWAFWQHADNGTVSGVPASAVDMNYFNGTLAELLAFGGSPAPDAGAKDSGTTQDSGAADSAVSQDSGNVPPTFDSGSGHPAPDSGSAPPDPGA